MEDVEKRDGNDLIGEQGGEFEDDEFIGNPFKRALMVIFSPTRVYESVRAKSTRMDWLVPIVLSILFSLVFINSTFEYLRYDQRIAAIERIENSTKLSEEQKATQIEQVDKAMDKMGGFSRIITNVATVVGPFMSIAVIALALLAVTNLMLKASLSFGDAYKISALGVMPGIVGILLRFPLTFYFGSVDQSKLSLTTLLPEGMGEMFFVKLLDFDIFTLWYAIVIAIGMAVFTRMTFAKTFVPLCAMWLIYRVAALSLSGALSGLGG